MRREGYLHPARNSCNLQLVYVPPMGKTGYQLELSSDLSVNAGCVCHSINAEAHGGTKGGASTEGLRQGGVVVTGMDVGETEVAVYDDDEEKS